jgi:hypothetical protein
LSSTESYNESSHQIEADTDEEVSEMGQKHPVKIAVEHHIRPVQVHIYVTVDVLAAIQVLGRVSVGCFVAKKIERERLFEDAEYIFSNKRVRSVIVFEHSINASTYYYATLYSGRKNLDYDTMNI